MLGIEKVAMGGLGKLQEHLTKDILQRTSVQHLLLRRSEPAVELQYQSGALVA
jgi:hypothetical protein